MLMSLDAAAARAMGNPAFSEVILERRYRRVPWQ
jgi:hypothetical protein